MVTDIIVKSAEAIFNSVILSAKKRFKDRYAEVKAELDQFQETIKANVINYTQARLEGKLTDDELRQLVSDDVRLAAMKGLTEAGITAVQVEDFRNMVISKVLTTLIEVLIPALL
jgi:hypothetical protein